MDEYIVKLQHSIHWSGLPMMLAYSRDRSFVYEAEVTSEIAAKMGDDPKQYWLVYVDEDGLLVLKRQVEEGMAETDF